MWLSLSSSHSNSSQSCINSLSIYHSKYRKNAYREPYLVVRGLIAEIIRQFQKAHSRKLEHKVRARATTSWSLAREGQRCLLCRRGHGVHGAPHAQCSAPISWSLRASSTHLGGPAGTPLRAQHRPRRSQTSLRAP